MMSHTCRATLWISSLFAAIQLAACSSTEKEPAAKTGPLTQVYEASYEEVWRALQKSLAHYPIRLNNADTGQIETDSIRPEKMWQPAHKTNRYSPGMRYYIKATATRGVKGKNEAVRLALEKVITIERDFFSGPERLPSDGLEEESLFYRIQREITLERSLKNAYDQGKL